MSIIAFRTNLLDGNHHGPNGEVVTRGFLLTRMGAARMSIGLWWYRSSGKARLFHLAFPRWLTPFPDKCWQHYIFARFEQERRP